MSALLQIGLARLAARRTLNVVVACWAVAVIAFALLTRPDQAPHFGFARQQVWATFLVAVAPLCVLRAAQRAAPMQAEDASWLAVRSASNAAVAVSTWLGALVAWCAATLAFALAGEIGAPRGETLLVAAGTIAAPASRWVTSEAPLAWRAEVQHPERARRASLELGLVASHGAIGDLHLVARGVTTGAETRANVRVENRARLEVELPRGETAIDFRLECGGAEARAFVLSPAATLWFETPGRWSATSGAALHVVAAGASWLALALFFACFVGGTTAACAVLALWIPVWMADWPAAALRWIPGADLFDALAVVGAGRAPAPPGAQAWLGALVLVGLALAATALALRRFRVSP